jgi:hypothetical protein
MSSNAKIIALVGATAVVVGVLGYLIGNRKSKKKKKKKNIIRENPRINDTFNRSIRTRLDITPMRDQPTKDDISKDYYNCHEADDSMANESFNSPTSKAKVSEYLETIKPKKEDSANKRNDKYIRVLQLYANLSKKA